ncbi:MAG: VOC family protein [Candidatus Eremiobacter antarcticus]|nr:VOC family protein [Candidatus Eremiobacteraeota bacterium]
MDQVNVIASDLRRSPRFYRQLGIAFPRPLENSAGQMFHAASSAQSGALVELDSPSFAPVWNAGWAQRSDLVGRVVLGFRVCKRETVDQRFKELTGDVYRALQPPFDAFWGARYAIVEDPDGIAIGLMSPIDASTATAPPPEWTL